MAATVEGVFKILDRASPALDSIYRKATLVDEKLDSVGHNMDQLASKGSADMRTLNKSFGDMSRTAERDSTRVSASFEALERKIGNATSGASRDIAQLQGSLSALDATEANPTIDLNGYEETLAKIATVRAEMRALSRESANMRIGVDVSEVTGSAGGGGGGTTKSGDQGFDRGGFFRRVVGAISPNAGSVMSGYQKGGFGGAFMAGAPIAAGAAWRFGKQKVSAAREAAKARVAAGFATDSMEDAGSAAVKATSKMSVFTRVAKMMASRVVIIGLAIAALGPILEAFAGALGALVGTTGGAIAAAGAGGTGLIGAAIVGFGGMYAAIRPLLTELGAITKAQTAYNQAVWQFGQNSQEARDAQKALNAQMRMADRMPGGLRSQRLLEIGQQRTRLGNRWRRITTPGQRAGANIMQDSMGMASDNINFLGGIANSGARGGENIVGGMLDKLDSPMFKDAVRDLADLFENMSPQVGSILGNMARTFANIADAASPLVIDFIEKLDKWMGANAGSTSRIEHWSKVFKNWEKDLRQVSRFLKEVTKWLLTFFDAGRGPGRSLLGDMTRDIRASRKEMQADNGKGVQAWFAEMVDRTEKVWHELEGIAESIGRLVHQIGSLIGPYAQMSQGAKNAVSQVPIVGPTLAPFAGPALVAGGLFGARALGRAGARSIGRGLGGVPGGTGIASRMAGWGLKAAPEVATVGGATAGASIGGKLAGAAGRVAGKLAIPVTAGLAIADMITSDSAGGTVGERGQDALSGATLGIIPNAASAQEEMAKGAQNAAAWASQQKNLNAALQMAKTRIDDLRISAAKTNVGEKWFGGHDDEILAEADALERWTMQAKTLLRTRRALKDSSDMSKAFDIRMKAGDNRGALSSLRSDLGQKLRGGVPMQQLLPGMEADALDANKGVLNMAQQSMDMARAAAKGHPKMKQDVRELTGFIEQRFKRMGIDIGIVNGKIYVESQERWNKIANAIGSSAEQARQEAHTAFTRLQQEAVGQLVAMGMDKSSATKFMGNLETANTAVNDAVQIAQGGKKKARGGIIPGRMQDGDVQPLGGGAMGMGGERVVNRHQMGLIDRFLSPYGMSVDKAISSANRPHNVPAGRQAFARGGVLPAAQLASQMGLSVSEGPGYGGVPSSGHASGSLHYSGLAYDISGSADLMRQYFLRAWKSWSGSINELFYDPMGYYYDEGQRVQGSIGGHSDHVHIGFFPSGATGKAVKGAAGLAAGVAEAIKLKGSKSKLKGIPGAIAQRAMDIGRAGMEKQINKKLGAGVGGAVAGGGLAAQFPGINRSYAPHWAPDYGGETLPFSTVAKLAEAAGMPGLTMAQIAKGESGLRPGSAGTDPGGTHGYGLWAITDGFNDELIKQYGGPKGMWNPINNALAAKSIYDSQGIGAWYGTKFMTGTDLHYKGAGKKEYGRGGMMPFGGWHARGGNFDVHGPTMIGVGESGSETLSIKPKGQQQPGHGGGNVIHVLAGGKIEVNRKGDVKKILDEEFRALGMDIEMLSGSEGVEDTL